MSEPGDDGPGYALRSLHPQLLRVQSPAPAGPEGGRPEKAREGGLQRRHPRDHVSVCECGGDSVWEDTQLVKVIFSREM